MLGSPLLRTVRAMTAVGLPAAWGSVANAPASAGKLWPSTSPTAKPNARSLSASGSSGIRPLRGQVGLEAVAIDDDHQVVEALGAGDQRRLPHRALVELAVAHDDEHARRSAAQPRVDGDPHADRQQVAERTRVELDAGDGAVRVPVKVVVDRQVVGEARGRKVAALGQRAVQRRYVVALRQQQIVAPGIGDPIRSHAQHAVVQVNQQIRARQRRAQEAASVGRHADRVRAHAPRLSFERAEGRHGWASDAPPAPWVSVRSSWA